MSDALESKLVQQSQRRNFNRLMAGDAGRALGASIVQAMYFPLSSDILRTVRAAMALPIARKETFFGQSSALIDGQVLQAIERLPDSPTLLCFFPSMRASTQRISSELPVLEVKRASAGQWYRLNAPAKDCLDLFFCATPDVASGMAIDVCAGEPGISGSDAPILELVTWGWLYMARPPGSGAI